MEQVAGSVGNVTVLKTGDVFTSVQVRTKYGRVVATLEVYNDGLAVYASTGPGRHDRLLVGPNREDARSAA